MGLGKIRGCDVDNVATVPGQVNTHRPEKWFLKGVDGIVFVADSLEVEEKPICLPEDLAENLNEESKIISRIPLVIQFNKRDLQENGFPVMPVSIMEKDLNGKLKVPYHLASAIDGNGVAATLKGILLITLRHLQKELHWARENKTT
jgi:signal recognition particle receptor subunit beta